jgi:acyl carrier protein
MDGHELQGTDMKITNREGELRALLAEVSGRDTADLDLDADLIEVFGLDSLAGLRLLAMVEKRFDVRFEDEHLSEYRTLASLLVAIDHGGAS